MIEGITLEELEAASSHIARTEFMLRVAPNEAAINMTMCGCMGPLPECRCQKRKRLVGQFLEKVKDISNA